MMQNNQIKDSINRTLSLLPVEGLSASNLLAQAKGGRKVKKKLSIAAVIAIALVMISLTAIAVELTIGWKEAFHFLNKESKEGLFAQWKDEDQILLVSSLIKDGMIAESKDSISLLDETISVGVRAELARTMMENWLSMSADFVSFRSIMERHWGQFQSWDVEQKAWYTDTLIKAEVQAPDMERFVLPSTGQIPQDMAERIAKTWASVWLNIPMNELEQYRVYVALVIFPKPQVIHGVSCYTTENMKPEWQIDLVPATQIGGRKRSTVFIDAETGTVDVHQLIQYIQAMHYGRDWPELAIEVEGFMREQEYKPFFDWSIEAKAAFSSQFREQILAQDDGVLDEATRALANYRYDLPAKNAISEQDAIARACQVIINQMGIESSVLEQYDQIHAYYDSTTPMSPKWRIVFTASGKTADALTEGEPDQLLIFRVEIDALTSEVVSENYYHFGESIGYNGILAQL